MENHLYMYITLHNTDKSAKYQLYHVVYIYALKAPKM